MSNTSFYQLQQNVLSPKQSHQLQGRMNFDNINANIKQGENGRIILYNNTIMRHPIHLHGHYFRVLNGQGDYPSLKNMLGITPMERDTIELWATESGD
ncbi:multicopper oxidase domain-containing protein [Mucilaginibacter terrenus]|uniref:multicopper oxidase domain-containing protein n=1 Tax=Mucilaginibacter terrenus TaxID=2482727 RepID=UPI001401F49F|nr:multicopper oxidase domain-containing protein [Mucilaginibacter terrenus]